MKIEHTTTPTHEDIEFLTESIMKETPDAGTSYPFAFFTRGNSGEIIAGCDGEVIFDEIYTDQLWVHPDYRKQGLARKLMESVHEYGRKAGCLMATVHTMSFQNALKFYEKLGYVSDFERKGYKNGVSCIFLRKDL